MGTGFKLASKTYTVVLATGLPIDISCSVTKFIVDVIVVSVGPYSLITTTPLSFKVCFALSTLFFPVS
jgi:hypothetical protein